MSIGKPPVFSRLLKKEGMEPDDLLCSRNARPQKALVGRAQWKINQPPSLERNEQAWKEHVYRPMCAEKDILAISAPLALISVIAV